jgi:hypothetical protein
MSSILKNMMDKAQKTSNFNLEGKSHDIRVQLEHSLFKPLMCLVQGTGISKENAITTTKLLTLQSYKTEVVHTMQSHDPVVRFNFCK